MRIFLPVDGFETSARAVQFVLKQVVMSTRGMGAVANMMLGSAATKVLDLTNVPVLLVK